MCDTQDKTMLKILRCGWCGCFCDNTGRIFQATKQLIKADEIVGFDCKGECEKCSPQASVQQLIDEEFHNKSLAEQRRRFNKYMSTGSYT